MIGVSLSLIAQRMARLIRFSVETLVDDRFSDVSPSPMSSGIPCFPGPGTRTVTGGDRLSTNGLDLSMDTGEPADSSVQYGLMDHVAGRAFIFSIGPVGNNTNVNWWALEPKFGWNKNGCLSTHRTVIGPPGFAAYDRYALVRLDNGQCAYFHRSMAEAGESWKMHFTSSLASTAQMAAAVWSGNGTDTGGTIDAVKIVDLITESMASKEGMSSFYTASVSSSEITFAHPENMFCELLVSSLPSTGMVLTLSENSAGDYLYLTVSSGGSLEFREVYNGVDSLLGTKTVTTNDRVLLYVDDGVFGVAVDNDADNVTFSSVNVSGDYIAGTGTLAHGGATLANFYVYPRVPKGAAALSRASAGLSDPNSYTPSGEYGLTVTGGDGGVVIEVENESELFNALSGIGPGLVPATPRIVRFGPNAPSYIDLTERLEITGAENVTFDGAGSHTVVRRHDKKFFNCNNIKLVDLTLAGGEVEFHDGICHAAQFVGCADINIQNCTFVFGGDETLSFTGCNDVYIGMCLIGDAVPPQQYGLFFASGDNNRVLVVDCAISNVHIRAPLTQGGAGNHWKHLYIHGTYVGPVAQAHYGNIQLNLIGIAFGTDLTDNGDGDWMSMWSYPIVPYEATVYWDELESPYHTVPDEYGGNVPLEPAALQDSANVPAAFGDLETLVQDLIDRAGRRVSETHLTFDAITTEFKSRMIDEPDILSEPYWPEPEAPWYLAGDVAPSSVLAAYQPWWANSLEDSYVNIASPGTYDIAALSAPSWDMEVGWTFDGIANSLNTGILHNDSGQNWSVVVMFSGATGSGCLVGDAATNNSQLAVVPNSSGRRRYQNSGNLQINSGGVTSGIMAIAGATGYYNGVSDGSISTGSQVDRHILIGSGNSGNSVTPTGIAFCLCDIQAVAIYNTVLTGAQVLAIYNALSAM